MADNFAKLWLQKQFNKNAIRRAQEAIQSTGNALPCHVVSVSGAIVTVAFDVTSTPWTLPKVTIPKAESQWIRMPTQVGDKGWTVPADAYLGPSVGFTNGVADLTQPGNLSALVFVPLSNKNSPPDDQNAAQIMGPNGGIMRTSDGSVSIVVNTSGITMKFGSKTVVLNGSGLTIDGILFDTHVHGGVTAGGSNTTGPA